MTTLCGIAHAKLNLTLDVVGKRPDGFHDLTMVMQEISLGDEISITLETGEPWTFISTGISMPCDDSNLIVKAAHAFFSETGIDPNGVSFSVVKRIPVCAGMGGGSSDAACVLRILQEHYGNPIPSERLYRIAEQLGSDVPFALFGKTALAEEKGQVLSRLPDMPACSIVICKPDFPISTPVLFREIDSREITIRPDTEKIVQALEQSDIYAVADALYNVFEPVVSESHPEIALIKSIMKENGCLAACMSGSGPTVFGLFEAQLHAEACFEKLKESFSETHLVYPI